MVSQPAELRPLHVVQALLRIKMKIEWSVVGDLEGADASMDGVAAQVG